MKMWNYLLGLDLVQQGLTSSLASIKVLHSSCIALFISALLSSFIVFDFEPVASKPCSCKHGF